LKPSKSSAAAICGSAAMNWQSLISCQNDFVRLDVVIVDVRPGCKGFSILTRQALQILKIFDIKMTQIQK